MNEILHYLTSIQFTDGSTIVFVPETNSVKMAYHAVKKSIKGYDHKATVQTIPKDIESKFVPKEVVDNALLAIRSGSQNSLEEDEYMEYLEKSMPIFDHLFSYFPRNMLDSMNPGAGNVSKGVD